MLLICPYCLEFQIARVSAAKTNMKFWQLTVRMKLMFVRKRWCDGRRRITGLSAIYGELVLVSCHLRLEGGDVHQEFLGKFESGNLSRDNFSREIGRSRLLESQLRTGKSCAEFPPQGQAREARRLSLGPEISCARFLLREIRQQ